MRRTLPFIIGNVWLAMFLPVLSTSSPLRAADDGESPNNSTSPDERWECRLIPDPKEPEGKLPVIVKAGTSKVVLKLDKESASTR